MSADAPDLARARRFVAAHAVPGTPIVVGVTGAHLYGFPSRDSDVDLKGIHLAPLDELLGLGDVRTSFDRLEVFEGVEHDLTLHEARTALELLLRGNGNILERLATPHQLYATEPLTELRALLPAALSRRVFGHYRGYFRGMCEQDRASPEPRAKTLLYIYRVALTGAHLLRTGEIVCDVAALAPEHGFPEVAELVAMKRAGAEKGPAPAEVAARHRARWPDLEALLRRARAESPLPEEPAGHAALSDWLARTRRRYA